MWKSQSKDEKALKFLSPLYGIEFTEAKQINFYIYFVFVRPLWLQLVLPATVHHIPFVE